MAQPVILVVEDEPSLVKFLCSSLRRHDYTVLCAATGQEATVLARTHNPELVLLDLGLPDMDGLLFLQEYRAWSACPVLVLSARSRERQKVEALDLGADDYLAKPFGLDELLARIRVALRRRVRQGEARTFENEELCIDLGARKVLRKGCEVRLTPLEYKLLEALLMRGGKVVTHQQLLQEVWGPGQTDQTQYLHIYMGQLRKKLEENPTRPTFFKTEPGVGYRLEGF